MKRKLLSPVLFLVFVQLHATGFIHRDGNGLRDSANTVVKLNGVNLGGWLLWEGWIWGGKFTAQSTILQNMTSVVGQQETNNFRDRVYRNFIGEDDIKAISKAGLNVVRVPFNNRIFDTASCNAIGWQILDSLLGWCAKYHVYAVLDMHAAPSGQSSYFIADPLKPNLWKSENAKSKTVDLWKKIAQRYKNNRWVAGYDLLNEPIPDKDPNLLKLYQQIIAAIRTVDQNHLVILEGSNFAKNFKVFQSLPDPNMAFSFHIYTWFGGEPAKKIQPYADLGKNLNVPIWCGEWGENTQEVVGNTLQVLTDPGNGFDGWSFWTWKKTKNSYPALNEIRPGDSWKTFITWCCKPDPKTKPSANFGLTAIRDFEEAMLLKNCSTDQPMLALLSSYSLK